ncbi:MAG: glycosyltransferase family 4 protein, partial [Chitinophagaceae bacterium]
FKQQKKLRLTATLHGHYEFLATLRQQFQTQTAYALQQIDAVVYTTQTHLQTLAQYGYPQQKTHKILYGIAIDNLPKLPINQPKQPLQLIMASRGIEEKGWWYAIEAVLAVNKQIPNSVQLTLLGEGAYLQQLKQTYQQEKALQFLPHTNNVIPILLSANIGLLPSYYIAESLPNIVIEYLLCGKPVIASQIGAIKEMLAANGEEAGFCLPLSEGKPLVNEVKNAILQYLRQPALLQKHSELAVVASQKFKMSFCVQQYCELFNRL